MANQNSYRLVVVEELLVDAEEQLAAVEEVAVEEEAEGVEEEAEDAAVVDPKGDFVPFHFVT